MPKLYPAQQIHKIPVLAVSGMTKSRLFCLLALIAINISLNAAAHAEVAPNALPSQGQVVAGQASITQQDAAMTIHQTSDKAIIDWQSFSIGKDAQLNFQQPDAHAVALNRVITDNASEIYGHLNANGHVYFVNPKGVLFAPGSHVDVGGLVASTQNISNEDFLAGKNQFQRNGAQGSIVNQGEIIAHNGGTVALLSPNVSNQGIIVAQQGDVVLAGGDKVTLQAGANGHLQIAIDPTTVDSLIENKQLIKADGGQVIMTTAAASSLWSNVVSNTGTLEAKEMAGQSGQIKLLGDMQHGTTQVDGTLDASAPVTGNGGFIETSAAQVKVAESAKITTKSNHGSQGNWLIDPNDFNIGANGSTTADISSSSLGNALGNNDVTIQTTSSNPSCTGISCNSGTSGNGDIFVNEAINWGGSGSTNRLTLNSYRNIYIKAPIDATSNSASGKVSLLYGQGAADGKNDNGSEASYSFGLTAAGFSGSIKLNAGANLSTQLGSSGTPKNYTVITSVGSAGSTTTTDLQGINGGLTGNYALGADIDASATSGWNSGSGFTPIGTTTSFSGSFDGLGHGIQNLTITTPAITRFTSGIFASSAGQLMNVSLDNIVNTDNTAWFNGALAGANSGLVKDVFANRGNVVSTLSNTNAAIGGIVGQNSSSAIMRKIWTNLSVSGGSSAKIGGLVGDNRGIVDTVVTTGAVIGGSNALIGGIAGQNYSTNYVQGDNTHASIVNALASGAIIGGSNANIGSLVGYDAYSTITDALATGAALGPSNSFRYGSVAGISGPGSYTHVVWDSNTTGSSSGIAGTGLTTSALQGALNDLDATNWSVAAGQYPYLKAFFPNGMQTVWGIAYTADGSTASSTYVGGTIPANLSLNGELQRTVTTGANGYYYFALPIIVASNGSTQLPMTSGATKVLTWTNANGIFSSNAFNIANHTNISNNNISQFNLNTSWTANAGANTLLSDISLLIPEFNTYTSTPNFIKNGDYELSINANGAFNVDRSFTRSAKLKIVSGGNLTLNNVISVSAGDITLSGSNFLNTQGSSALIVNNPYRWLVYSSTAANNNFGGLVSGNSAIWNTAYNAITPSNVASSTGNRYIFSGSGGTVTIHTHAANKTYGSDPLSQTDLNNTLSYGFTGDIFNSYGGVYTAILPSIAASFTTAPSVTSSGNLKTANAGDYGYILNTGTTIPELSVITDNTHLFTVNKAHATVTANSDTKNYTGLSQSVSGFTASGLVNGETEAVLTGVSTSGGTGTNAGSYTLTASGTDRNYILSFINGYLVINKAQAIVTANSDTKNYTGLSQSVSGFTASGLVNGETEAVLTGVSTSGGTGTNAGSYTLTASGTDRNYTLSFIDGHLVINKAQATVTANSDTKNYTGLSQSVSGFTASGLVNGETEAVLTGVSTSGGTGTHAGSYTLTASGTDRNYTLSFVDGSLIIQKIPLTITANDQTKSYGRIPYSGGNGVSSIGFVNAETLENLLGILSYGGNSQGAINTGFYVIKPQGLYSNNYNIDFKDGKLTILPDHIVNSIFKGTCIQIQNNKSTQKIPMKATSMCGVTFE